MDVHKYSATTERLEVVETGRRRCWSDDEKLRILLESLETPGAGVPRSIVILVPPESLPILEWLRYQNVKITVMNH